MKKIIWDYFNDEIQYPKEIVHNPIPYGTVWTYVSSTFLNGFINYVNPIACFVIDRYTADDVEIENVILCNKGDILCNWYDWKGSKKELTDAIVSGEKKMHHTNLGCFDDDIIILAKIETENNDTNKYIFFWFDMDVSDCSIGKFETNDIESDVIQSVINWLDKCKLENMGNNIEEYIDNGIINYHQLPLEFIKGWVSF
ncbi:hypothetical protein M0Q97_05725 [Candidatus Dojkabacteria bacterium]|jgi:hypothetical protein|nr:hypothetical protein [Candidatus Dojkabacteria bacterium]